MKTKEMHTIAKLLLPMLIYLLGIPSNLKANDGYVFRSGICVLNGQIQGMTLEQMPNTFTIHLNNIYLNQTENVLIHIDPNGNFSANIPLPHGQFAYWEGLDVTPFLMVGDTINAVYHPLKGLKIEGNNVTAQVNRYWPILKDKYLNHHQTYRKGHTLHQEDSCYFEEQYRLFKYLYNNKEQITPTDCLPLTKEILYISLLENPFVNILNKRLKHELSQLTTPKKDWKPLDNTKFFKFLQKYEKELLDNPYLPMGQSSWTPFNYFAMDNSLFFMFYDTNDYSIEVNKSFDNKLAYYASELLLPKEYDPNFIKEAETLRKGEIFTFSNFIDKRFQEYLHKTNLHNNFALQVALCIQFHNFIVNNQYNGDYATERIIAILPYITYPQIRFHLLQYYRKCIKEHEGVEKICLEKDSIFQRIIRPYADNILFIDFWGMRCGPCRREMLKQRELVKQMKNLPVKFLYICNEKDSPRKKTEEWMQKNNIQGEHIFISPDEWNHLQTVFQFSEIPFSLLVDKKGKIRQKERAINTKILEKLLKE